MYMHTLHSLPIYLSIITLQAYLLFMFIKVINNYYVYGTLFNCNAYTVSQLVVHSTFSFVLKRLHRDITVAICEIVKRR